MDLQAIKSIIERAYSEGRNRLLEPEAKQICKLAGLPVDDWHVAKTADEAVNYASRLGYPVVMKIVSPQVVHKSDVGGVMLNLDSEEKVRAAYSEILENVKAKVPEAEVKGILVERMAPPGIETIVGALKDPQFGPTIMFGLGGIFVEVFRDVSFRVAPLTEADALSMIREIKAYPVLAGARGKPPADIGALISTLMKTSQLVVAIPEIRELDFNPTIVYPSGARIVDARIILEKRS